MQRLFCALAFPLLAGGPAPAQSLPRPPIVIDRLRGAALERHVERLVKARLGPYVDDVHVDAHDGRGTIAVEVELVHPDGLAPLHRLLYAIPELAGCQIRVDVNWND